MIMQRGRLALISIALVTVLSCGAAENNWVDLNAEPDVSAPTLQITGVVRYLDVEGGVFVIQATDGIQYVPINLPDSYKIDEMDVVAEVRHRDDLVSAAMTGPLVELLRIRTLP
jgi:hypothetical protein